MRLPDTEYECYAENQHGNQHVNGPGRLEFGCRVSFWM